MHDVNVIARKKIGRVGKGVKGEGSISNIFYLKVNCTVTDSRVSGGEGGGEQQNSVHYKLLFLFKVKFCYCSL